MYIWYNIILCSADCDAAEGNGEKRRGQRPVFKSKGSDPVHAYDRISRYKAALMGIMILIVVYGHLLYYHSGLTPYHLLNFTEWYTVGSVDIFLFLSGFGIYRSLKGNRDPLRFMQRRLSRLLPSYLPFILVYCGFMLLTDQMDKWQALGNLTTFGWWTQMGGQFNWYIPLLVGAYLVSPLLFAILEKCERKALWVFPVLFLLEAACVGSSLMMGVSRLPVYFLGMYLGREAALGKQPSKTHLWVSGLLLVGSMTALWFLVTRWPEGLSQYGFWWHPFLLSTVGGVYLITWLLERMERWKPTALLIRLFEFLGGKSFEIYLWHLLVYTVGLTFQVRGWKAWIGLALLGLLTGVCYGKLIDWFTKWRKHES